MASKYATAQEPIDTTSPWQATGGCENDHRLRLWGFEIWERDHDKPPVWRKLVRGKWVRFTQEMAERYMASRKGGLEP